MADEVTYKEKMGHLGLQDKDYVVCYKSILCKYQGSKNNLAIAAVFGRIFYYTTGGSHQCFDGSKETLANELFIDIRTVRRSINILLKDNLVIDITPPEYNSQTQVRSYVANIKEFKKLETVERPKRYSLDKKKKEEAIQKNKEKVLAEQGIDLFDDD